MGARRLERETGRAGDRRGGLPRIGKIAYNIRRQPRPDSRRLVYEQKRANFDMVGQ